MLAKETALWDSADGGDLHKVKELVAEGFALTLVQLFEKWRGGVLETCQEGTFLMCSKAFAMPIERTD